MSEHTITSWIRGTEGRDPACEEALWNHYFHQVIRLARGRMFAIQASVYDEEDAAASALNSLFRRIRDDRLPRLHSRDNLWRLLALITHRKLIAQRRRQASRIQPGNQIENEIRIGEIVSRNPTADDVAAIMDETERLLTALGDDQLRKIAVLRMDGHSTSEIANTLHLTSRTIRRKIERIRDIWGVSESD